MQSWLVYVTIVLTPLTLLAGSGLAADKPNQDQ